MNSVLNYIDLIWLPIAWFLAHKPHRIKAIGFVLACLLTLRTQAELLESIDHDDGFFPWMDAPALQRGQITYSVAIMIFLILAHFSPRTDKMIFFAAALSVYILTFCMSLFIMMV